MTVKCAGGGLAVTECVVVVVVVVTVLHCKGQPAVAECVVVIKFLHCKEGQLRTFHVLIHVLSGFADTPAHPCTPSTRIVCTHSRVPTHAYSPVHTVIDGMQQHVCTWGCAGLQALGVCAAM